MRKTGELSGESGEKSVEEETMDDNNLQVSFGYKKQSERQII